MENLIDADRDYCKFPYCANEFCEIDVCVLLVKYNIKFNR